MFRKIQAVVLLIMSTQLHADLTIPGIAMNHGNNSALALTDSTLAKTGIALNQDDITAGQNIDAVKLTEAQLHEARVWELTEDDEKRYVLLMQNRSGVYYRGLRQTPIDVLGINARNEAERNRFAELAARHEAQKVATNIAWNNAFYKAYNKLFARVPVVGEFDKTPFSPMAYRPVTLNAGDTLFLFIKPDDAVRTVLLTLMDAVNITPDTRLNLMFLNADDTRIQQWANFNQIPRELVNNKRISLNHGELQFENLALARKTTPLLLLTRQGASSIVDLGVF